MGFLNMGLAHVEKAHAAAQAHVEKAHAAARRCGGAAVFRWWVALRCFAGLLALGYRSPPCKRADKPKKLPRAGWQIALRFQC